MPQPDLAQLNIEISAQDATEEDIDRMTRQLLSELRETDVDSAALVHTDEVPLGTKAGDAVSVGSILISALPAVLPAVVELVQAWAARGQGRMVKFKGQIGGGMIEFEGSAEEWRRLMASLEARQFVLENQPAQKKEDAERKTGENADRVEHAPARNKPARSARIFISYRRTDSADV